MSNEGRYIKRERLLAAVFFLIVIGFAARLIQIQVIQHDDWSYISAKQTLDLCDLTPPRGQIQDRNGMTLAVTLPLSYAVGFRPTAGINLDDVARKISSILPLSYETVRRKLDAPQFVYLARRVDWKLKQHLEAINLGCLQFDQEPRRAYPAASTLASVVGFTNVDGVGQEGIERSMNLDLTGAKYQELRWRDAKRTSTAVLSGNQAAGELRGADITLTVDLQLQTVVEKALEKGLADLDYSRSCALLIDPWTGDILALATQPTYDPNRPSESEALFRKCWPVTDVYEPGSTLKIVPITEALESNVVNRSTHIYCENGAYHVPGAIIHDSHAYGDLTVDGVLTHSSNIGAAKIAAKCGSENFYNRLRSFGFGSSTGIDIAGEQSGIVPKPQDWSGPTCSNLAMGHGISCTPLQLAMAYAAIANGGSLMKPNLVYSIHYPDGTTDTRVPKVVQTAMSPETSAELADMLVNVVKSGTGRKAAVGDLLIAGKTGTAQKVDLENHTYFQKRFVSSFVGFFPADEPRYLLLVVVDDPLGQYFGAAVAAPVFAEIASQLWVIRPADFPVMPEPKAEEVDSSSVQADSTADSLLFAGVTPPVLTDPTVPMIRMPSIEGMPLRRAALELSSRGLDFQLNGSGIVFAQYPKPGDMVPAGYSCLVHAQD
jgi:cell division protein FtsI (penicillin-binding protein 3)